MKRTFGAPVPYDAASYIEELEEEVDRLRVELADTIGYASLGRERRRSLLAEVDRLTQEVAHLNYRLASPFTTWRGICGHLWDRAVENTDECPRCAMEARLPKAIADGIRDAYAHSAQDERARIAAEVRGLPRYSPDLHGTVLFGKRRPSVHTDVDGSFVDRAAVLAAIEGAEHE